MNTPTSHCWTLNKQTSLVHFFFLSLLIFESSAGIHELCVVLGCSGNTLD